MQNYLQGNFWQRFALDLGIKLGLYTLFDIFVNWFLSELGWFHFLNNVDLSRAHSFTCISNKLIV